MAKRMTVVFHDEGLYTDLKVQAARTHKTASEIVAEAVREWLEASEDARILPEIETARREWQEKGGRPWAEVEEELEQALSEREGRATPDRASA